MSEIDAGPHHHIDKTSAIGPYELGSVFGNVVYHHFFATRHIASGKVTVEESERAWRLATERWLPFDSLQ